MKKVNLKGKNSLVFILILIFWHLLYRLNLVSSILLPSPMMVFKTFIAMLNDGSLLLSILISLYRVLLGFSLAFILAFVLALIFYLRKNLDQYLSGILNFLKNIPPLGLVPLLILWLGIGEITKIIMVFMASFFPLFFNIRKGFMNVDEDLIDMAKSFSYTKKEIFTKIVLVSSLKDIFIGMRISLGYAYRSIIASEMLAASSGLGYLINFSRQMSRTDKVIVALIVLGLIGMASDFIFVKISSEFLKGDLKNGYQA